MTATRCDALYASGCSLLRFAINFSKISKYLKVTNQDKELHWKDNGEKIPHWRTFEDVLSSFVDTV